MEIKMKTLTVKKLQGFVGHVCTILTNSVCKRDFTDTQFPDFFLGIVESIDEDGVFSTHPITGCKNFYSWPHIVGIFQEQVIEETNPEYKQIVEEAKKVPQQQQPNIFPLEIDPKKQSPFVNPDMMAELAKQAKEIQRKN
jgi:hypothetical protein